MQDFDRIRSFIQSFSKDEEGLLGDIYRDAVERGVPVIRTDTKELLRLLLLMQKPGSILEVGTAVGYSALYMADILPEAVITTLELDPERAEEAKENIRRAKADDRITVIRGDAGKILEGMERDRREKNENILREGVPDTQYVEMNGNPDVGDETDGGFDFVFIDAAKAQYSEYLTHILGLVNKKAVIVSDNVLQDGSILESHFLVEKRDRTIHDRMREYLKRLTDTEGLVTSILPVGDGVAVTYVDSLSAIQRDVCHPERSKGS